MPIVGNSMPFDGEPGLGRWVGVAHSPPLGRLFLGGLGGKFQAAWMPPA
jgi:hypothetical protein